jgi:hypothetical protein
MKKLLTASILTFALAGVAYADDDYAGPVPRDQWMPASQVTQKLEAKGFKVLEIEADDGVYEFDAIDASGARIEGHAHPATGEVLNTHPDN